MKTGPLVVVFIAFFHGVFTYTGVCPKGWLHFETSCFFVSSERISWTMAEMSCRGHNARLAEIYNQEQFTFLSQTLDSQQDLDDKWVGGTDDIQEGEWRWMFTDQVFNFTAWGPSEPNSGTHGNCLVLEQSEHWKWDDKDCDQSYSYICELPSKVPSTSSPVDSTGLVPSFIG